VDLSWKNQKPISLDIIFLGHTSLDVGPLRWSSQWMGTVHRISRSVTLCNTSVIPRANRLAVTYTDLPPHTSMNPISRPGRRITSSTSEILSLVGTRMGTTMRWSCTPFPRRCKKIAKEMRWLSTAQSDFVPVDRL
jgi:hypothetical protein